MLNTKLNVFHGFLFINLENDFADRTFVKYQNSWRDPGALGKFTILKGKVTSYLIEPKCICYPLTNTPLLIEYWLTANLLKKIHGTIIFDFIYLHMNTHVGKNNREKN